MLAGVLLFLPPLSGLTVMDRYCHPRLTPAAAKVLQKHYLTMRSSVASANDDSIPVTTRHLESLIRLSQARARMELREEVSLPLPSTLTQGVGL
jgi:DNA replicative helicase MCM subunit Mcm2 (Cdc46/Mcm family)